MFETPAGKIMVLGLLFSSLGLGCPTTMPSDPSLVAPEDLHGQEGYPCRADKTCEPGLICLETKTSTFCVRHTPDCAGVWGGTAQLDNCNHCDADPTNDCIQDCNDVWGGSATEDPCGICDEDPTNDCTQDCNDVWGGSAAEDPCGICDEDPTNDCIQDCNDVWGGSATEDPCGICDEDPTNDCIQDCNDVWGGSATEDPCGNCDEDPTNDCIQDCNDVWGGSATEDPCGICDEDPTNDCSPDCRGEWGGSATLDACNICDDDTTNDCERQCSEATDGGQEVCTEPELAICGAGTLASHGFCIPEDEFIYHLPFPAATMNEDISISQGYQGYYSHNDRQRYAVDFDVPTGTPIAAARGGVVYAVKEDSNITCGSPSCGNDANYIRINHGDGTETLYLHLEHEGVDVKVDDVVCAGDVIGRSGNTGWSTGPHLHFAVVDAYGDTIPFLFEEMITISNGLPIPGYNFLSENTLVESCPTHPFTGCANDLYLHRGILLDSGFPCIVDQAVHIPTLSGTNISQSNQTFVRLTRSDGTNNFESTEFCLDNDVDGRFSVDIDWSEYGTAGDIFYVFVTAAEIEEVAGDMLCTTFYGWERSISVLLK